VHNNIGAIYEKEYMELLRSGRSPRGLVRLETSALENYQQSILMADKVGASNARALTNRALAFKYLSPARRLAGPQKERNPLIDDWVSPILPSLRGERAKQP